MTTTNSGTPVHLICSGCGRSLVGTFFQIGERYLCTQCFNLAQAIQPIVFVPANSQPGYTVDWLAENVRLTEELRQAKEQIAELEARQISPELEQMCEDFIGQRDADSYPMSRREENSFARSIGLKLVELVEARQQEDEVQS